MHLGYKDKSNFRLIFGLYYFSDSFLCSRFVRIDIQTNRRRFLSLFIVGQTLLSLSNYKSFFKIKIQQCSVLFSFQHLLEEVALVPERSIKISMQVLLSTMALDPEVSKFLVLISDICWNWFSFPGPSRSLPSPLQVLFLLRRWCVFSQRLIPLPTL